MRLIEYKDTIEKVHVWGEKWLKVLGCEHHKLRISCGYRRWGHSKENNPDPVLACILNTSRKLHIPPTFYELSEYWQEEVIKHEMCHIKDSYTRTLTATNSHDHEFLSILSTIGAFMVMPFGCLPRFNYHGNPIPKLGAYIDSKVAPNLR